MTLHTAPFAAKTLSEHEIQALYRIDGLDMSSGPPATLSALAAGPGIAEDQSPALAGRYGDTKVWKRAASTDAGQDFHRHIRDIVGGRRDDLATRWVLDDAARTLVESANLYEQNTDPALRVTKRLVLLLTDSSRERLRRHAIDCDVLLIRIRAITLTLFRTGHGFAATIIDVARSDGAELTALELLEAQILITRFGKLAWRDARTGDLVAGTPFVIGDFVQRLACGEDTPSYPTQRVTTYTYAQFADPVATADRDTFALHLARHYTTDYVVSADIRGVAFVADFETVRHAVALEGAATIVGATPERPDLPPFVRDFKTATFRRHYLHVALLARHEHAFLVERTSASVISKEEMMDAAGAVERLERLRGSTLMFRLCYRFSELSFITMHNALNRAFREVMHLDKMMDELGSDVASVEAHLRELREAQDRRLEQEKHRRYYWVSVLGGAALAGLTTYTIAKETGELGVYLASWLLHYEVPDTGRAIISGCIGVVLGIGVGATAFWIGRRRGPAAPDAEHGEHLTVHSMLDHMIHAALRK